MICNCYCNVKPSQLSTRYCQSESYSYSRSGGLLHRLYTTLLLPSYTTPLSKNSRFLGWLKVTSHESSSDFKRDAISSQPMTRTVNEKQQQRAKSQHNGKTKTRQDKNWQNESQQNFRTAMPSHGRTCSEIETPTLTLNVVGSNLLKWKGHCEIWRWVFLTLKTKTESLNKHTKCTHDS